MRRVVAVLAVAGLALAGCGRARGVAGTTGALEQAGYRGVDVTVRSGAGIGVARVEAAPGGPAPERAAEVAWATLPVRFDRLVVAMGPDVRSYGYQELVARFGPRPPSLDRKQIDEDVVRHGFQLMLLLTVAAALSVGGVVTFALVGLRAVRRRRPGAHAGGPTSGAGDDAPPSPTAGASALEGDEIPS